MDRIETIKTLSGIHGISGGEGAVATEIAQRITPYCERVTIDPLGNVIAEKKGKARAGHKLMLSAHMDEVGFIITAIDEDGRLHFAPVGGISASVVVGKPVVIAGRVPGVIGQKALHQRDAAERDAVKKIDDLTIDIGADDKADALRYVKVGDAVTFASEFIQFGEKRIKGKALDDRAGCAALIALIEQELAYDCTFVFTVQEEVGGAGAAVAANTVAPEIGLIVETTTASDIEGVSPHKVVCSLGKGPVVSFMDKGTIYDQTLYHQALKAAETHNIPCQVKEGVYGGNESHSVQQSGAGVKVLAVSMPCRYLHSPACVLDEKDIDATISLLAVLIETFAAP